MSAAFTPGPWGACKNGKCSCGMVWSITADHPVATVEAGEWGDKWPALRFIESEGMGGTAVEAYMAKSGYGHIPELVAHANARLIAAAPSMFAALQATADFLGTLGGGQRKVIREQVANALALALEGDLEREVRAETRYREMTESTSTFASAGEAGTATDSEAGVAEGEHAVPQADAQ